MERVSMPLASDGRATGCRDLLALGSPVSFCSQKSHFLYMASTLPPPLDVQKIVQNTVSEVSELPVRVPRPLPAHRATRAYSPCRTCILALFKFRDHSQIGSISAVYPFLRQTIPGHGTYLFNMRSVLRRRTAAVERRGSANSLRNERCTLGVCATLFYNRKSLGRPKATTISKKL